MYYAALVFGFEYVKKLSTIFSAGPGLASSVLEYFIVSTVAETLQNSLYDFRAPDTYYQIVSVV